MSGFEALDIAARLIAISHGNTDDTGRSFPLGGASSGTTSSGPHSSDLANKADPRIDSDRDGSRGFGTTSGLGSGTGAVPYLPIKATSVVPVWETLLAHRLE